MNGSTNAETMTTDTITALAGKEDTLSATEISAPITGSFSDGNFTMRKYGKVCVGHVFKATPVTTGILTFATAPVGYRPTGTIFFTVHASASNVSELCSIDANGVVNLTIGTITSFYGHFAFITN